MEDKFHGNGILFKGNGDIIEGNFENGLLKGKATFYPNNGEPYDIDTEEDFEDDNDKNSTMEKIQSNINSQI